jgi:hypothetical protein
MLNAVVIPFPKRAAAEMRANLNVNGPAQVIIFPGVRYIRLQETDDLFEIATAPRKAPSKGKK